MDTIGALAIVAALVLIALAAWFIYSRERSRRLQERFGPEYRRAVDEVGSRAKAESALRAREKRVGQFHIVPLAPPDAARFAQSWKAVQGRFVDNPKGSVVQADQLVRELMEKRGYPMADFENRAADLSVDHPTVVGHYRAAQAIVVRDGNERDTEALREAVVHYRALFDELLADTRPETAPARQKVTT